VERLHPERRTRAGSGDDLRSEAVAFGAGRDPIALADELAALASRTSG
jgi:hypothetical protein